MMHDKLACILQGDIRFGSDIVIEFMCNQFELVILSTWEGEKVPKLNCKNLIVLYNRKPKKFGKNNRNLLRMSTASGIKKAKEKNVDYILKWRTDMLPVNFDIKYLMELSKGDKSIIHNQKRIVTSAYRTISLEDDWYSTLPDLFHFGNLKNMELLWNDDDIDFSKDMNIPLNMYQEANMDYLNSRYYNEAELYAIYKNRLQNKYSKKFTHRDIVLNFFSLIDQNKLGIVWFGNNGKFRVINAAWGHSWWTVEDFKNGNNKLVDYSYTDGSSISKIKYKLTKIYSIYELLVQNIRYFIYRSSL